MVIGYKLLLFIIECRQIVKIRKAKRWIVISLLSEWIMWWSVFGWMTSGCKFKFFVWGYTNFYVLFIER